MLTWLHIGDLHVTTAHADSFKDMQRVIDALSDLGPEDADFALLPGDNADDGTPEQFRLVRDALAPIRLPLHILPGDHDFKPKSLRSFHEVLGIQPLPYAATVKRHRCLFLDVVSAGTGGPDFRLTDEHLDWVEREIADARSVGEDSVVFMHTYPADLKEGHRRLTNLLAAPELLCVDMGHTHFNELANDGGTIFMATRSTGQIEEGPPGFSVAAVDSGGVSWRFKPADEAWPCVVVTQPVDRRLVTGKRPAARVQDLIRAKILGDAAIRSVEWSNDGKQWHPMACSAEDPTVWEAPMAAPAALITVRAEDAKGRRDQDIVEPVDAGWTPPPRFADGSDRDRIGAWPAKGLFDTQLGPNRNGRKW